MLVLECILARLILLKLCKKFQSRVILNFMYLFVCNYVCKCMTIHGPVVFTKSVKARYVSLCIIVHG